MGKEDSSSADFVERRRGALERQGEAKLNTSLLNLNKITRIIFVFFQIWIFNHLSVHQVHPEGGTSPITSARSRCQRVLGERRCKFTFLERQRDTVTSTSTK